MENKNIRHNPDKIEEYTITKSNEKLDNNEVICFDDNYLYVKTSKGWKRVLLTEF